MRRWTNAVTSNHNRWVAVGDWKHSWAASRRTCPWVSHSQTVTNSCLAYFCRKKWRRSSLHTWNILDSIQLNHSLSTQSPPFPLLRHWFGLGLMRTPWIWSVTWVTQAREVEDVGSQNQYFPWFGQPITSKLISYRAYMRLPCEILQGLRMRRLKWGTLCG